MAKPALYGAVRIDLKMGRDSVRIPRRSKNLTSIRPWLPQSIRCAIKRNFSLNPLRRQIFLLGEKPCRTAKHLDDAIVDLIVDYSKNQNCDGDTELFRNLIAARRKFPQNFSLDYQWLPDHMNTYNDIIVRYVLNKVTVLEGGHLLVAFRGGAVEEQVF